MKLQTVAAALALVAGTAFAQAPNETAKAPAAPAAGVTATTATTTTTHQATTKKMAAKKHRKAHTAKKKATAATMGASAAMIQTDLDAPARRSRIDQAYANWQASRR